MLRNRFYRPLVFTLFGLTAPLFAQNKYIVVDLGSLGGTDASRAATAARGINNLGQVVGDSTLADGTNRGFRTAPNMPINPLTDAIGTLGGLTSSGAAINDSGQITGVSGTGLPGPFGSEIMRAYRADPGQPLVDLGTLAGPAGGVNGFNNSNGNAISNEGRVVGSADVAPNNCFAVAHGFRTGPNQPILPDSNLSRPDDIGTLVSIFSLSGCFSSVAFGINTLGLTVGDSRAPVAGNVDHAVKWLGPLTGIIDLGTLPGGKNSIAWAVNDLAIAVGQSEVASNPFPFDGPTHAFASVGDLVIFNRDLGTLGGTFSIAQAINSQVPSTIVGGATTGGDAAIHAFRYNFTFLSNTDVMEDLNNLIPNNSGWVLQGASGVNNLGQIIGSGLHNGVFSAFRLDPLAQALPNLIGILPNLLAGFTPGEINSFSSKLGSANASMAAGNITPAVNQLNAFVNEVQAYQRSGRLSASTATLMIETATDVISSLN